ncbi:MAG: rRNA adenine N(6)-methyltransferase family protein, partial [Gaiellaceae bacterium]
MAVRARRSASPSGQHFLRSSALAAELVRAAGIGPGNLVLDLGAGTGVLTRALARTGARVVAVEIDPILAERLRSRFSRVVEDDVLRTPLPREPFHVVANLPFGCGTAILRRLLEPWVPIVTADVIVEWGLAEKRTAVWPSTRLSVEWGAWFELTLVRRLQRSCFAPPPAVDAALMRAVRREKPLVPPDRAREFRRFVEAGFRGGPEWSEGSSGRSTFRTLRQAMARRGSSSNRSTSRARS